jgi:hypothetical protein
MKLKKHSLIFPKQLKVDKIDKDNFDRNLIVKKLKKYGFFDENGKWKEK